MATTKIKQEQPTLFFETQKEFRAWLEENHSLSDGIWLKFFKKGSGVTSLNYDQALDEALLAYGLFIGHGKHLSHGILIYRRLETRRLLVTCNPRTPN